MKILAILCVLLICGCASRHERELSRIQAWAKQIGVCAFDEAIMSSSIDVPSGYPKSKPDWEPEFASSTEYLDWLWQDFGGAKIMYRYLRQNPFCVVLDLPIFPIFKRSQEGGRSTRVIEERLVKMPFLFTRNLEISMSNGVAICNLTTNWPFGKRGVAIYTYYGDDHFLKADEVQGYFNSISFTNAVLRP